MNKFKKSIRLISELLAVNTNGTREDSSILQLEELLDEKYRALLMKGHFPAKSRVINDISKIVLKIKTNEKYQSLIGRPAAGLIGDYNDITDICMSIKKDQLIDNVCRVNDSVPVIFSEKIGGEICFRNRYNLQIPASAEKVDIVLSTLNRRSGVDISKFIMSIDVNETCGYKGINLVYFPASEKGEVNLPEGLLNSCEMLIVNYREGGRVDNTLFSINRAGYNKDVYIISEEEKEETCISDTNKKWQFALHKISKQQLKELLNDKGEGRMNTDYVSLLYSPLLRVEKFYRDEIEDLSDTLSKLNKDIVLWDENNRHLDGLRKLREDLQYKIDEIKNLLSEHQLIKEQILDVSLEIRQKHEENFIHWNTGKTKISSCRPVQELLASWFENALLLIEMKQYETAEEYIKLLKAHRFRKLYIVNLCMQKKRRTGLDAADLDKLSKAKNTDQDIIKAKITHYKNLNLTVIMAGELCSLLDEPETPQEFFLYGMYLKGKDDKKAIIYFKEALKMGVKKAGLELAGLYKKHNMWDEKSIRNLAGLLVPEANYELGLLNLESNHYMKGVAHLKIAGVLGESRAVFKLADMSFHENKFRRSLALYELLYKNVPLEASILERMGIMYYVTKQSRRSLEVLSMINTAESNFYIGKLYMTEEMRDFETAREYMKRASDLGHEEAQKFLNEYRARKPLRVQRTTYSSKKDYSTRSSTSSSGGCFITTAVCLAVGQGSDCDIVIGFKKYRDNILRNEPDGLGLIEEYYAIAPTIVDLIDRSGKSKKIYQYLWDKYIVKGHSYLQEKKFKEAKELYIKMVVELKERYLK